jgi:hypothetical protein
VNFRTTLSTTPKFIRRTPPAEITRDGDGERELPVELPGQAADEGNERETLISQAIRELISPSPVRHRPALCDARQ